MTNEEIQEKKELILKWKKRVLVIATLIGLAALIVICVYGLNFLAVPVSIVIWTVIIVFLLRGIVAKFESLGLNRVLGTAISYLIMILVIVIVCLFMFSPAFGLSSQIENIINEAPKYIEAVREWAMGIYNQYSDLLSNETIKQMTDDIGSNLANVGTGVAAASAGGILAAGGMIGNSFMAIGIAFVISFWILIELPKIGKETQRFIRPKYKRDASMWYYAITHVMAGYIKGTFIQCLIIGICSGIWFAVIGLGNPAAFGCITGVLNIIPIVGPWIGGLVAGLAGIFTNWFTALLAVAGTIAIQQFVYTFISPKIMSDSVDIHPALSLFALTVGGALGGAMSGLIGSLVGMLLSIPAVAVFKAMFIFYYEKRTNNRIVAKDGVFFKGFAIGDSGAKPMIDALNPGTKDLKIIFKDDKSLSDFCEEWQLDAKSREDLRKIYESVKRSKKPKKNDKDAAKLEDKDTAKLENTQTEE